MSNQTKKVKIIKISLKHNSVSKLSLPPTSLCPLTIYISFVSALKGFP